MYVCVRTQLQVVELGSFFFVVQFLTSLADIMTWCQSWHESDQCTHPNEDGVMSGDIPAAKDDDVPTLEDQLGEVIEGFPLMSLGRRDAEDEEQHQAVTTNDGPVGTAEVDQGDKDDDDEEDDSDADEDEATDRSEADEGEWALTQYRLWIDLVNPTPVWEQLYPRSTASTRKRLTRALAYFRKERVRRMADRESDMRAELDIAYAQWKAGRYSESRFRREVRELEWLMNERTGEDTELHICQSLTESALAQYRASLGQNEFDGQP